MVIFFVKFRSALSPEAVRETMDARLPQFRAQPGLVQKYYAYEPATGEWSGVYLWESHEALAAFRGSQLARSIPAAYQVVGAPRVEVLDVLFPLRRGQPASVGWDAAGPAVGAAGASLATMADHAAGAAPASAGPTAERPLAS